MNHERTHLDLFSGIGGFALAANWNGVRTVGFCEREPYAHQVLRERFEAVADPDSHEPEQPERRQREQRGWIGDGRPRIHPDIRRLNGTLYRGVWLITGGFPCQPFSLAGKRLGAADDRALWPEMLRVIEQARPTWVLGENVPGIITLELDRVLSDLERIGYSGRPFVVPACAVDAGHRRDRVWIVAHTETEHGTLHRPQTSELGRGGETVADTLRNGAREGSQPLRKPQGPPQIDQGWGRWSESRDCCEALADANQQRLERGRSEPRQRRSVELPEQRCIWQPEPDVGRVAYGIPHRAHRLRGLGNAIVPQVAAEFIRFMIQTETQ